ncbi:uncharacterized protein LOC108676664 [Hyalella azteca]|uniref:Uncharacterized protein LOC108676664 n=1 Tax=Hyalella azteca TaxID=294128 RepID=A0A8B7P2L7_HYAAZ|nr:uncharacterized protein LOC108676664 [Hyalella azteca]
MKIHFFKSLTLVVLLVILHLVSSDITKNDATTARKVLRSQYNLKERFKRIIMALDGMQDVHSRQKRLIHFTFRFPAGTELEVKWALVVLIPVEEQLEETRYEIELASYIELPAYLADADYQPPFNTLFGTKNQLPVDDAAEAKTETKAHEHRVNSKDVTKGNSSHHTSKTRHVASSGMNKKTLTKNRKNKKHRTSNIKNINGFFLKKNKTLLRGAEKSGVGPGTDEIKRNRKERNVESSNLEYAEDEDDDFRHKKLNKENERTKYREDNLSHLHLSQRRDTYEAIGKILTSHGLAGRQCVLRTVCEVAEAPLHFGFIGDILNILFTPSVATVAASRAADIESIREYLEAEELGRTLGGCDKNFGACPSSIFQMLPVIRQQVLNFGIFENS